MGNLVLTRIQLGTDRVLMVPSPENGTVELRKGTAEVPGDLIAKFDENGLVDPRTWVNVQASRAMGQLYVNETPMSVLVHVTGQVSPDSIAEAYMDNRRASFYRNNAAGLDPCVLLFEVPSGSGYSIGNTLNALTSWWEYRLPEGS